MQHRTASFSIVKREPNRSNQSYVGDHNHQGSSEFTVTMAWRKTTCLKDGKTLLVSGEGVGNLGVPSRDIVQCW